MIAGAALCVTFGIAARKVVDKELLSNFCRTLHVSKTGSTCLELAYSF
jgi:hypothetical protein